jgi:hypothetical protein
MRLSRLEMAKRIASGAVKDPKLISLAKGIPECVETVYVYDTAEGYRVIWQEPNTSQWMN